jgi:hypothetical protein
MSKEEKANEWDSLWQEYTKSLENWKTLFEQVQNANNDMLFLNRFKMQIMTCKQNSTKYGKKLPKNLVWKL